MKLTHCNSALLDLILVNFCRNMIFLDPNLVNLNPNMTLLDPNLALLDPN